MGDNPSRVTGSPLLPVNQISWSDARGFCKRLTERERTANRLPEGYEYRLPTEAEWEYAGRAGTDKEFVVPLEELAYGYRHFVEVGTTPANPWGLYEVLGNVAEWCLDQWSEYPKDQDSPTVDRFHEGDPSRAMFIVRGHGFWYTDLPPTVFVRAPRHDIAGGFRGFRVVLGPTIKMRYGREVQVPVLSRPEFNQ
jgi:formylglycine-generating enzyme required for sulfatase activity